MPYSAGSDAGAMSVGAIERRVALITGASSGIGAEFARQLAAAGWKVVLVARRRDRLESLADELAGDRGRAHVLDADLSDANVSLALADRVEGLGLEVDLLVNNAGVCVYGPFVEQDPQDYVQMLRVNSEAMTLLTRTFLPGMIARGKGNVLNVASIAGVIPTPYVSGYSATKAFVLSFTKALGEEVRGTGVSVMSVTPGPVPTELQALAGLEHQPNFPPRVTAARVVSEALRGVDRGKRNVSPGYINTGAILAAKLAPSRLQSAVSGRMYRPRSSE